MHHISTLPQSDCTLYWGCTVPTTQKFKILDQIPLSITATCKQASIWGPWSLLWLVQISLVFENEALDTRTILLSNRRMRLAVRLPDAFAFAG